MLGLGDDVWSIFSKLPDNRQEGSKWRWTKLCFPSLQDGPHPPLGDQPLGLPSLCLHGCAGQLTGQIQQLVTSQEARPSLRGYYTGYDSSQGNLLFTRLKIRWVWILSIVSTKTIPGVCYWLKEALWKRQPSDQKLRSYDVKNTNTYTKGTKRLLLINGLREALL